MFRGALPGPHSDRQLREPSVLLPRPPAPAHRVSDHWKSDPALETVGGQGPTIERSISEGQESPGSKVALDPTGEICSGIPGPSPISWGCVLGPWFTLGSKSTLRVFSGPPRPTLSPVCTHQPWLTAHAPPPAALVHRARPQAPDLSGGSIAIKGHIARQEAKNMQRGISHYRINCTKLPA